MALGLGKIRGKHLVERTIERGNLEYPTVDVSFGYLAAIDKIICDIWGSNDYRGTYTSDMFRDKAIESWGFGTYSYMTARYIDIDNYYYTYQDDRRATADYVLRKVVAGSNTVLGTEAVDLSLTDCFLFKLRCAGESIEAYRTDMITPKIAVTDTSLTEGRFGVVAAPVEDYSFWSYVNTYLRGSPVIPPKVLSYFEVPVIGSGTRGDPFRAEMPEKIAHDKLGKINKLALTHSSIIKTGKDGKPTDYRAIVRIFDQPDRQLHLYKIQKCLTSLKAMRGVKKLDKDKAKREALRLDDKLKMEDLSGW